MLLFLSSISKQASFNALYTENLLTCKLKPVDYWRKYYSYPVLERPLLFCYSYHNTTRLLSQQIISDVKLHAPWQKCA